MTLTLIYSSLKLLPGGGPQFSEFLYLFQNIYMGNLLCASSTCKWNTEYELGFICEICIIISSIINFMQQNVNGEHLVFVSVKNFDPGHSFRTKVS